MLHWTFDHNDNEQGPYFANRLVESLRHHYESGDGQEASWSWQTLRYDVLPNFWYGYSRHRHSAPQKAIHLGDVEISRHPAEGETDEYRVLSRNDASGERVQLEFTVERGTPPFLVGEWSVASENTAGDLYRRFSCRGYSRERSGEREIHLVINECDIAVGRLGNRLALSCNWALFDLMPRLAERGSEAGRLELALLEDLEKIRPENRVSLIEDWPLVLGERTIPLRGFCVQGVGVPPAYWWVDPAGDVVVVASTFQTLVLRERIGGRS